MKKKIFNLITYSMVTSSFATAVYSTLPEQLQFVNANWVSMLLFGGLTGLFGGAGMVVDTFLKKSEAKGLERYQLLAKEYMQIAENYKELKTVVDTQLKQVTNNYEATIEKTKRMIKLLQTDLNAKLSNELIDQKVRDMIEGVLNE